MNRPSKDEYYLNIAKAVAMRSTCLRRKYGAVIVKDDMIVSTGYNGAARKLEDCLTRGKCKREELNIPAGERYELCEAVHAEQNAILQGHPERMKGATIYIYGISPNGVSVNSKPCKLCERFIRNAWISRVVFINEYGEIISNNVFKEKD